MGSTIAGPARRRLTRVKRIAWARPVVVGEQVERWAVQVVELAGVHGEPGRRTDQEREREAERDEEEEDVHG